MADRLLVDTSVWSLAFRRPIDVHDVHVDALRAALTSNQIVVTTGVILQELLQGVSKPRQMLEFSTMFSKLGFVNPDKLTHTSAAEVWTKCRKKGVQLGTVDALLVALCLERELTMLTTDRDFTHASRIVPLRLWRP